LQESRAFALGTLESFYSLRPKINAILEFKFCPIKNATLASQPQKTRGSRNFSHKRQRQCPDHSHKRQQVFWSFYMPCWFECSVLELHLFWDRGSIPLFSSGPMRVAGDDSGVHCGQRGARPHPQQVSTALQSYSGQLVDIGPRAQAAQQSTQAQCGRRRRFSGG
jgi:hypothetical protein